MRAISVFSIFILAGAAFFLSAVCGCGDGGGRKDADAEPGDGDAPDDAADTEGIDVPDSPDVPDGTDTPVDGTEDLDAPVDDGPPLPHDNENSPLGTNLSGIADWSTEWSFVDVFRMSREWISGNSDGTWDDGRAFDLDENGWVRSLQGGQIARTLLLWEIVDVYPAGAYTVLYEGEGTIEYWNAAVKNEALSAPGRDVIDVDPSRGGIGINITAINADDHLRNIRVIMPGGVCEGDPHSVCSGDEDCSGASCSLFVDNYATQVFHPTFLARIRTYRILRFMDWMATNGSPIAEWSERPRVEDARWSGDGRGVPVEVMVDLANRLGADPWFTLPHLASDDYIRSFATLVRDSLDPDLHAWIEYSNEVWNGIFAQAGYAREQGLAAGLSTDEFQAQLYFYSRRTAQMFALWEEVFGGTDRLVRVMGSQAANSWVSEQVLSFEDASLATDALAIAPYFGGYLGGTDEESRVQAMSVDDLVAELTGTAVPDATGWMQAQAATAASFDVDLVAYEGGQHLAGVGGVENNETINALFDAVNRDPGMRDLYLAYLEAWHEAGGKFFVHFTSCGRYSKWGRWGSLEYLSQPRAEAPKYDALQTFIETTPIWW